MQRESSVDKPLTDKHNHGLLSEPGEWLNANRHWPALDMYFTIWVLYRA